MSIPGPPSHRFRGDPPKTLLIIAIDFGTTYSGVAYTHSALDVFKNRPFMDPKEIVNKIHIVRSWPKKGNAIYSDKIQSALAYENGQLIAWGGAVTNQRIKITGFKLGLEEKLKRVYKSAPSALSGFLTDSQWMHPELPHKDAVRFVADYLEQIKNHIFSVTFPRHFGDDFMNRQPVRYVITVPAIWSDKAKALTREAAVLAGIQEQDLDLVTEPEAAALFCATLSSETSLEDGDHFLVCDAGGGTVVRQPISDADCRT